MQASITAILSMIMHDSAKPGPPDILCVSGTDAGKFLQAQLTCDVGAVRPGQALPFAWCTAKGRVRHSGWLLRDDDGYTLLTSRGRATALAGALARFVFRDQVVMTHGDSTGLSTEYPATGQAVTEDGTARFALGSTERCIRIARGSPRHCDAQALVRAGIAAGVWELTSAFEETYLPQMINLDLLGGVSFDKGCYPGQEIIARTRNLGRVTRRMIRLASGEAPPAPGAAVMSGQIRAGEVVVSAAAPRGSEMLAVIRLDTMGTDPLTLESGAVLKQLPLPYRVPELDKGA